MRFWRLLVRTTLIICILMIVNLTSQSVEAKPNNTTSPALTLVWQTKFAGDAVLASPGDIAVDEWGNSYVSTQGGNSVKKFDSDGNFVTQWGDSGKGEREFSLSLGMAVDSHNDIYVTDFDNKRIQKFDSNGTFLLQWATEPSTSPAFLGVDGQGNVYVDEFPPHDNHYIQKFDGSGTLVGEWGAIDGRFSGRIEDIAVDKDGNIFVADPILNRVQKLDSNGNTVATYGGKLSKDGKGLFEAPFGIASDTSGNIYVLDGNFLQKLDAAGNFIAQWSTKGGDLDRASNVTVDAQANIYVFAKADVPSASGGTVSVFVLKKFRQAGSPAASGR